MKISIRLLKRGVSRRGRAVRRGAVRSGTALSVGDQVAYDHRGWPYVTSARWQGSSGAEACRRCEGRRRFPAMSLKSDVPRSVFSISLNSNKYKLCPTKIRRARVCPKMRGPASKRHVRDGSRPSRVCPKILCPCNAHSDSSKRLHQMTGCSESARVTEAGKRRCDVSSKLCSTTSSCVNGTVASSATLYGSCAALRFLSP